MKIKVCGMREDANIRALAELSPDYIGLIFYAASKRFVDQPNNSLLTSLSSDIKLAGVFVDEDPAVVLQKVRKYDLKTIQLHGSETPEYCKKLKKAIEEEIAKIEVIKAFGIDESFDFKILELYITDVDYFLFDTNTPAHGGSGLKFNWNTLKNYHLDKPYFLSGGIGLEDLYDVITIKDPRLYAVDLNSKFETSPGLKDIGLINRAFSIFKAIANNKEKN